MKEQFQQVAAKVATKTKYYAKEMGYFLSSLFFLKNFAMMIATIVGFVLIMFWWMRCYTNHGESLQVHDYVGMDLKSAIKKANSRSFEIVVSDSIFIVDRAPNVVLAQNPKPLSRVKENRRIYLTVTKNKADLVTLPDLAGSDDYGQYTKKLRMMDVKFTIKERIFNNQYEENTILHFFHDGEKITGKKLKKGVKVPKGSTLEFVVTEKGGGYVEIPDLICKKFSEAEFLISGMQLNLGKINKDGTITNQSSAYVWRQFPTYEPSETMRMGEQIEVWLTQNKPSRCGGN